MLPHPSAWGNTCPRGGGRDRANAPKSSTCRRHERARIVTRAWGLGSTSEKRGGGVIQSTERLVGEMKTCGGTQKEPRPSNRPECLKDGDPEYD